MKGFAKDEEEEEEAVVVMVDHSKDGWRLQGCLLVEWYVGAKKQMLHQLETTPDRGDTS